MHDVIGIHPRHETRTTGFEAHIESVHEPGMRETNHPDSAGSRAAQLLQHLTGAVSGPVVNRHHLEVAQCLAVEAGDALAKVGTGITDRKQDGDGRTIHDVEDSGLDSFEFSVLSFEFRTPGSRDGNPTTGPF